MKKIKHIVVFMNVMAFTLLSNLTAYASISDSTVVKGTQKLFEDATNAGMILSPVIGVALIIYFLIRKSTADEADQKKWKTYIMIDVVCMIGVVVASAVINIILGYYK